MSNENDFYTTTSNQTVAAEIQTSTTTMTSIVPSIGSVLPSAVNLLGKVAETHSIQPWMWPESAPQHAGYIMRISLACCVLVLSILLIVVVNGSRAHRFTSLSVFITTLSFALILRGSLLESVDVFHAFRDCGREKEKCGMNSSVNNLLENLKSGNRDKTCEFGHDCYRYTYRVECPLWMAICEAVDMLLPFSLLALSFERLRVGCGGRTGYCGMICFVIFAWILPVLSSAGLYYLPEIVDLPKLVINTWMNKEYKDCRLIYSWYYWIITASIRILPIFICFLAGLILLCMKKSKSKCTILITVFIDLFYMIFIAPHYVMQVIFHKHVLLSGAVLTRAFNLFVPIMLFLYEDMREATRLSLCASHEVYESEEGTPMKEDMEDMHHDMHHNDMHNDMHNDIDEKQQPQIVPQYEENVPLKASPDDYSI